MIRIKYRTPLSVCVQAGRTCWQSQDKGGCYTNPTDDIVEADKGFLERILKKHKHGSVAEHIRIYFMTDDVILYNYFKENPYSYTYERGQYNYEVSTNLRVLLEIYTNKFLSPKMKLAFINNFRNAMGKEYEFLLDEYEYPMKSEEI